MLWLRSASSNPGAQALWILGQVAGTCYMFEEYVGFMTTCVGESMMPTFRPEGSIVFCSNYPRLTRSFERGDVVVCKSPTNPGQLVCKRIIAMGGDDVTLDTMYGPATLEVPRHYVFLRGDNSERSMDSRFYGPVPYSMLKGRVVMQFWPFNAGWGWQPDARQWRSDVEARQRREDDQRQKAQDAFLARMNELKHRTKVQEEEEKRLREANALLRHDSVDTAPDGTGAV